MVDLSSIYMALDLSTCNVFANQFFICDKLCKRVIKTAAVTTLNDEKNDTIKGLA